MFIPVETGDGSSTFYSESFGEWFHSRGGACCEAQETYVNAVRLAQRVRHLPSGETLKILDVCYGLGYNTAAALETIWQINPDCAVELKALEIDIEVARSAIAQNLIQHYCDPVQAVLRAIATDFSAQRHHLNATLLCGDARQTIQPLVAERWQADIIFLDPFSPPHCPQLWTTNFLSLVAKCLSPSGGTLVTYSCAAAVRSALMQANLTIESFQTSARKWPGTLAYYSINSSETSLISLSQQEREHLQTKAAVPYRDPTLQATAEEILAYRVKEQQLSQLLPTGPWRSRWKKT